MSQLDQLSDKEIEERYSIRGAKPVAFMLGGFAKAHEAFSVHFRNGEEMFVTTLLAAQADKGRLIFDCSGSVDTNRQFVKSDKNQFRGHPGGVPVHFSSGMATEISFEGAKAFSVALPDHVIRLQRREHFRIETPRVNPLILFARLADGRMLKLPVHDISVGGAGVDASELPEGVDLGTVLENCHFALPGDSKELYFSAMIRNYREFEMRSGQHGWRIGVQFNDLPMGDQSRIQRYIAKVERERHELI
jgi:c-di-GMP-binding flagellar brake protein YcgR